MTTYAVLKAKNPLASGQTIFDAGVKEGIRRVNEGDYPRGYYSRAETQEWRNNALDAAADIAQRYECNPHCIEDIRALKHTLTPPAVPRYAVTRQLPVCDLTPGSLGVAVSVWLSEVDQPVDAFYGVRCNTDNDPHPHFYYAGAVVSGVTHWHYREEPEKS